MRKPSRRRAGFALILVMTVLTLMLIFLIAAQGSVMTGRLEIKRSGDRAAQLESLNTVLDDMRHRLEGEVKAASRKPGEIWFYGNGDSMLLLKSDDPIFATLPGVAYRDGDALVTLLRPSRGGGERELEKTQFLMNAAKRRGAIRIR